MRFAPRSDTTLVCSHGRHFRFTAGALIAAAALVTLAPNTRADSVEAWGYNNSGQLGNGTTTNSPSPVQPIGLTSGVTAVAAAAGTSFAVQNGALYSWGNNGYGEFGNGTRVSASVPTPSLLLTGVTAVASCYSHALVLQNGALYGMGYNNEGELGNGTSGNYSSLATAVTGMGSGVTALAAGAYHSLAVQNGGVYAWGGQFGGALGNGVSSSAGITTPIPVAGLSSGVTAVAAGYADSFAIQNGALYAWGNNLSGQLGTGDSTAGYFATTPSAVTGLSSGVTSVATGGSGGGGPQFTLAAAHGQVYVMGNNADGEFGNGTYGSSADITSSTPVLVPGITGTITQVATDEASCFALSSDGSLWVWGFNVVGELGLGTVSTGSPPAVLTPTQQFAPAGYEFTGIVGTAVGDDVLATYAPVVTTPEPSALALLGLAAMPMLKARRRGRLQQLNGRPHGTMPRLPTHVPLTAKLAHCDQYLT